MSEGLGLLQLAALATLGFILVTSILCALASRATMRTLRRLAPRRRVHALSAWGFAPIVAGLMLVAVCLAPSALHRAGITGDHCLEHDDGHGHLCLVHPPPAPGSASGWMIIALAGVWLALAGRRQAADLFQTTRLVRALRSTASFDTSTGVWWIDSHLPVSMAAGFLRPRVLVARTLSRALSDRLLAPVIAHEHAHVRRRDALRMAVVRAAASMHLPAARRELLAELALACEQACDAEAAAMVGDRVRVAEAILAVERAYGRVAGSRVALMPSFGGSDVRARVEHLLAVDAGARGRRRGSAVLGVIGTVVALALVADPLHHATETVLALLG